MTRRRITRTRRAALRGAGAPVRHRAGMTLIEVIVVLIIVAMAATGITYTVGAITRANLRSACMTLTAASRYAYGRAIAQSSTVRLMFDLKANDPNEESTMSFEEAHGRVTLARLDDVRRQRIEDDEEDSGEDNETAAVDPWAAAQARLSDTLHPSFGASPFSTIPGQRYQPRRLASGIKILRVIVPHEPEPVTEGQAALYFFPGGQTENAVIWLGDRGDRVYSVEVHPLTGRTRVYDYAYEPEQLLDDGQGGHRSEVDD